MWQIEKGIPIGILHVIRRIPTQAYSRILEKQSVKATIYLKNGQK